LLNGGFSTKALESNLGSLSLIVKMTPGTYHYTSGLVDGTFTEFKGTLEVLPAKASTLPVFVSLSGHPASYDNLSGRSGKKKFTKKVEKENMFKFAKKSDKKHKDRTTCTMQDFTTSINWGDAVTDYTID
jgi:hypothetical protein